MNGPEGGETKFRFEEFEKKLREHCLKAVREDSESAGLALELWEGFSAIPDVREHRDYRMRTLMAEMGFLPSASTYSDEADHIVKGKERDG